MRGQKRHHTDQNIDKQLDKMLYLAAEQRLLPKIIYQYSFQHNSPQFANKYRESVKQIYTKQTISPLKYNQQQAKTHREKFRQKIQKLINNQLPIQYLKPMKMNGKYVMTYKDQPLQKVQYATIPQCAIFNDFSQRKFKTQYSDIFDDKLEYRYQQMFNPIKKQQFVRSKTKPSQQFTSKRVSFKNPPSTTNVIQVISRQVPTIAATLPKISSRSQFQPKKLISPLAQNIRKKPKRPKNINEQELIFQVMKRIGGFSNASPLTISVTKQSIQKYLKEFYSRPHRIIDFLQFKDVQSFSTFSKVPQNLKFMPNEHIYFMCFLFFDSNNDGYICSNDLLRLQQLGKKAPLLLQDHEMIRMGASKVKYQNILSYQDLYRLSQISQTTYFNWCKKQNQKNQQNPEIDQHNEQLKDYFNNINRKKVQIHYEGFKKLYGNQKPFLWYDIVYRISGVKYEGLKYQ